MEEEMKQLKFRVQRTVSTGDSSIASDAPSSSNSNPIPTKESEILVPMLRSTILWVCFGLVAWHYPRYLLQSDQQIVTKTPPYQLTAAGDVIMDFTLNEKVSDPPIIPCKHDCIAKR
jgi:hypothetical protein